MEVYLKIDRRHKYIFRRLHHTLGHCILIFISYSILMTHIDESFLRLVNYETCGSSYLPASRKRIVIIIKNIGSKPTDSDSDANCSDNITCSCQQNLNYCVIDCYVKYPVVDFINKDENTYASCFKFWLVHCNCCAVKTNE